MPMDRSNLPRIAALALTLLLGMTAAGGCVQRTLQIDSSPPGALVYLNGEEVGRTPMRKEFLWYGTYDVELRKEGYQTLKRPTQVWAPWWQWPPIDLFAEMLPLEDRHAARFRMKPVTEVQTDEDQVLGRAVATRKRLKSSKYTRQPRSKPPATTQVSPQ